MSPKEEVWDGELQAEGEDRVLRVRLGLELIRVRVQVNTGAMAAHWNRLEHVRTQESFVPLLESDLTGLT